MIGASTTLLGGTALAVSTRETEAISVDADFSIPDKSYQNTEAVSGVRLTVDGEYSLAGSVTPDRVVTRLEATVTDEFTQLAALSDDNVGLDETHDIQLEGNLLDIEHLTAADVNPTTVGESINETITARLTLSASKDGHEIGSKQLTDEFSVSIQKTAGSVTVSMGATGEVQVLE